MFFRQKFATLVLGILAAAVGFSYALATNGVDDLASRGLTLTVGPRQAGTLMITDPAIGNRFDLGDATFGSAIVRFAHAHGGIPPHQFISDSASPNFHGSGDIASAVGTVLKLAGYPASSNTPEVLLTGRVQGTIGAPPAKSPYTGAALPCDFDITVIDSSLVPNFINGPYQLTMVDSGTFKFAQNSLAQAYLYQAYTNRIEMITGNKPYTYSVVALSVTPAPSTGQPTTLQQCGLFLNPTSGLLTGRPIFPGTISFTVQCKDVTGALALSRDKSTTDQVFNLFVNTNTTVSTELFSTSIGLKGNFTTGGKDSISYSGQVNLAGLTVSSLNNEPVTLQIGSYTSPTVTLMNGKGSTAGTGPAMSASLSSTGVLSIKIKDESFGEAGSILTESQAVDKTIVFPVQVSIGDVYDGSELLTFDVKSKSNLFSLSYKFGPGNLGGGFIITGVEGKDDKAETGDVWKVAFISLAPKEITFDAASQAVIDIGTGFTETVPVTISKGKITATGASGKLVLESDGKGSMSTALVPSSSSGIPTALGAGAAKSVSSRFTLAISIQDATGKQLFGVEGALGITAKGDTWISKVTSRP